MAPKNLLTLQQQVSTQKTTALTKHYLTNRLSATSSVVSDRALVTEDHLCWDYEDKSFGSFWKNDAKGNKTQVTRKNFIHWLKHSAKAFPQRACIWEDTTFGGSHCPRHVNMDVGEQAPDRKTVLGLSEDEQQGPNHPTLTHQSKFSINFWLAGHSSTQTINSLMGLITVSINSNCSINQSFCYL